MNWLILAGTLVVVVWCWRHPRYFVPLLITALPLEISRTWYPHIAILNRLGDFVGVIDVARIAVLALLAYLLTKLFMLYCETGRTGRELLRDFNVRFLLKEFPLFTVLALYILVGLVSLIWSVDPVRTLVAAVRLAVLWWTGVAVFHVIFKQRDLISVPLTFCLAAALLGVLGIYQFATDHFLWFAESYHSAGRTNATFVDANIFARFLVIGMISSYALLLRSSTWRYRLIILTALLFQSGGLITTGSRTAWLAAVLALVGFLILIPRVSQLIVSGVTLVGMGVFVVNNPNLLTYRILALKQGLAAASYSRQSLISSGLDMFATHPLLGVGLGGFQHMMLTKYTALIEQGISLSHTALVTVAAELGIVGLLLTGVFLLCTYLPSLAQIIHRQNRSPFTSFAVLAISVIFISAQGEGRFLEDPFLWILVGYFTALARLRSINGPRAE